MNSRRYNSPVDLVKIGIKYPHGIVLLSLNGAPTRSEGWWKTVGILRTLRWSSFKEQFQKIAIP